MTVKIRIQNLLWHPVGAFLATRNCSLINLHIFRRECSIWIWHGCDCNLPWLIPRHWWPDSESSSYIPIPHLLDCLRHVHFWQPCLQYYIQRERQRQRKSRSLFAAAKKKQLKVSPKDKSWGGIRASLPFCVYMCLFCRARSALFRPFHSVQIILHAAQEDKQMPKRWWCGFFLKLEKFFFLLSFFVFPPNYLSEHV